MRRFIILVAAIGGVIFLSAAAAVAAPPTVDTEVVIAGTDTIPEVNPCTGEPGTVSLTFNSVFHITAASASVYHVSGTTTGAFEFVPNDSTAPSFTGHFTNAFSEQATPPGLGFVYTNAFTVVGTGSDGSRLLFHFLEHVTRLPSGDVVVGFTSAACR